MVPRTQLELIAEPSAYRAHLDAARAAGARIALVPTMGALHEGHLTLVDVARERVGASGIVAASIFVNPTQFGPNEDFARYPRQIDADRAVLASRGVDVLFAPESDAIYLRDEQTRVRVGALAEPLCGRFRPGHFEGVATIVAKLFALAGPAVAVFGRKDYQQLQVVRRMVRDLFLPIDVVGVATVREADGLAMSSRNRYLAPDARARATAIPRALGAAVRAWDAGERDAAKLRDDVDASVRASVDSVDYVDVRDADTLGPWTAGNTRPVIALAVRLGGARLIDNVVLGEDRPPT